VARVFAVVRMPSAVATCVAEQETNASMTRSVAALIPSPVVMLAAQREANAPTAYALQLQTVVQSSAQQATSVVGMACVVLRMLSAVMACAVLIIAHAQMVFVCLGQIVEQVFVKMERNAVAKDFAATMMQVAVEKCAVRQRVFVKVECA